MMAGPGQRPAIPHPIPKQIAPKTNFKSISDFLGLNNSQPKYDYFLYCFIGTCSGSYTRM